MHRESGKESEWGHWKNTSRPIPSIEPSASNQPTVTVTHQIFVIGFGLIFGAMTELFGIIVVIGNLFASIATFNHSRSEQFHVNGIYNGVQIRKFEKKEKM